MEKLGNWLKDVGLVDWWMDWWPSVWASRLAVVDLYPATPHPPPIPHLELSLAWWQETWQLALRLLLHLRVIRYGFKSLLCVREMFVDVITFLCFSGAHVAFNIFQFPFFRNSSLFKITGKEISRWGRQKTNELIFYPWESFPEVGATWKFEHYPFSAWRHYEASKELPHCVLHSRDIGRMLLWSK